MQTKRNHEGYYDPTAYQAIERVNRKSLWGDHLTYCFEEVESFQKAVKGRKAGKKMMVNKLLVIIVGTFIGHWIADKLDR